MLIWGTVQKGGIKYLQTQASSFALVHNQYALYPHNQISEETSSGDRRNRSWRKWVNTTAPTVKKPSVINPGAKARNCVTGYEGNGVKARSPTVRLGTIFCRFNEIGLEKLEEPTVDLTHNSGCLINESLRLVSSWWERQVRVELCKESKGVHPRAALTQPLARNTKRTELDNVSRSTALTNSNSNNKEYLWFTFTKKGWTVNVSMLTLY